MRIVHEITSEAQVGGGFRPYSTPDGSKARGMLGEVIISTEDGKEQWSIDELVYIEGDAAHIRRALAEAIRVIDLCAELHIEQGRLEDKWNDSGEI